MTQTGRRARVVHAIPGRLRIRFEGADSESSSEGLGAVRVAPGVLSIETKPAARSAVVRYDPAETTEAAVLAALELAGIALVAAGETASPGPVSDATGGKGGPASAAAGEQGSAATRRDAR